MGVFGWTIMKAVPEASDRYVISSWVFYLLGIMVVVPFQFYINSLDFWMYKFKPPPRGGRGPPPLIQDLPVLPTAPVLQITPSGPTGSNDTFQNDYTILTRFITTYQLITITDNYSTDPHERTPIQANFTAGFTVTSKLALLGALLICSFWSNKFAPPEKRLKWSLFALCIMFSVNTLGTQINPERMVELFFAGTMVLSTLMNFCTGMANASLYELISQFPPSYYASIQSGHNVCGIISSALQVGLLSVSLKPNINGAIYFASGTIILIVTTIFYSYTIKNSTYFVYKIGKSEQQRRISRLHEARTKTVAEHLLKIKWFYATLIFAEGTTHLVYPGLVALVVPWNIHENSWKEAYFVPVITFLGFQVFNLIGRETARIIKTPKHGIVLFSLAAFRTVLVPLLIFCNAQPRKKLPVFFQDKEFIFFVVMLAFSEGILVNMAIVAIPTILDKHDREPVMVLVPLVSSVTQTLASGLNLFLTNLI